MRKTVFRLASVALASAFSLGAASACLNCKVKLPVVEQQKHQRCAQPSPNEQAKLDLLGIKQVCVTVDAEIKKSRLQIPTEIMEEIAPFPFNKGVWWPDKANFVRFQIPKDSEFADHVICGYRVNALSEIPKPGKYLKHGFEHLTPTSINYAWHLKRRGLGKGRTSLHTDVIFSTIPAKNLQFAREQGMCMTDLTPRRWR